MCLSRTKAKRRPREREWARCMHLSTSKSVYFYRLFTPNEQLLPLPLVYKKFSQKLFTLCFCLFQRFTCSLKDQRLVHIAQFILQNFIEENCQIQKRKDNISSSFCGHRQQTLSTRQCVRSMELMIINEIEPRISVCLLSSHWAPPINLQIISAGINSSRIHLSGTLWGVQETMEFHL